MLKKETENKLYFDEIAVDVETQRRPWAGAGLIVTAKTRDDEHAVVLVTRHVRKVSALLHRLNACYRTHKDYDMKKYQLFECVGKAAIAAQNELGDKANEICKAIIDEAVVVAAEWDGRLYYAYGSNMDEEQMEKRCPSAVLLNKAAVNGYSFVIDKRGVASIVPCDEARVEGMLWQISEMDEVSLDRYEGVDRNIYSKQHLNVETAGGRHRALVYLSNHVGEVAGKRDGYMERILAAAQRHDLSEEYREFLRSFV